MQTMYMLVFNCLVPRYLILLPILRRNLVLSHFTLFLVVPLGIKGFRVKGSEDS